jgi:hypothetical protein
MAAYEAHQAKKKAAEEKRAQEDADCARHSRNPGLQARLNPDRFMDTYFLTDGKSDPTKTTRGLLLPSLQDPSKLIDRAKRIGLHACLTTERPDKVLWLAWEVDEAQRMADASDRKFREQNERLVLKKGD